MHESTKKCLQVIERLVAEGEHAAYDVVHSEFPEDAGPDEKYEKQIEAEFGRVLDEVADVLTKKFGRPLKDAPSWARLRATGWIVGKGAVYAFLERDDWDTPMSVIIGYSNQPSHDSDEDPWTYERKDA